MSDFFLEIEHITKTFPGVRALDDVSLRIRRGSVHALVGENGAGKSTLMKILTGMYLDYKGRILIEGKERRFMGERDALDAGISIVAQELTPIPELNIAENIFLGREPDGAIRGIIDRRRLFERTSELLSLLSLSYDPRTKMSSLSMAETQMVEIIKAISRDAKLIAMDEPTSALTEAETRYLFERIEELQSRGISIIFISHKLSEVYKVCDTISVMRDGHLIGSAPSSALQEKDVIRMMVGRELSELYPELPEPGKGTVFEAIGLGRKGVFNGISFDVKEGEILGLAGIMGAGRTEIVRAIFGLDRLDAGEMRLDGKVLRVRSPRDAIRRGIVMVSEDRKNLGLVSVMSILDNIALPNGDRYAPNFIMSRKRLKAESSSICARLNVKAASLSSSVDGLSGGNQQKIVLAKWLVRDIRLLIVDEPTRGIDVGAKAEIYRIMSELVRSGIAIIMISSELPEVIGMSHRVLVIAGGEVCGEMPQGKADAEAIMQLIVRGNDRKGNRREKH
jgi:ABC-type sugar transport system ATPase subunit